MIKRVRIQGAVRFGLGEPFSAEDLDLLTGVSAVSAGCGMGRDEGVLVAMMWLVPDRRIESGLKQRDCPLSTRFSLNSTRSGKDDAGPDRRAVSLLRRLEVEV